MHTWAVGRRRGARNVVLFAGGSFVPWRACGGSHGMCVHGHTSCVCFMVFHGFPVFSCGALCLGRLFPLMLSHTLTLLVSWRPRPMRAGDVSGRALLLVAVRLLCPIPRALRTPAPFRRVATVAHRITYNILVSAAGMFTWRLPYVVSLFFFPIGVGARTSP